MSDKQTFEIEHELTYYEGSQTGRFNLRTVLDLGILASERQETSLGILDPDGPNKQVGWVVTNYDGHLTDLMPHDGERIIVGTRTTAYNKLLAEREFWLRTRSGRDFARFRGLFVLMDLGSRKMIPIPDEMIKPFDMPYENRLPRLQRPAKFVKDPKGLASDYRVRFFDIDMNRHVNNAVYCDWMLDPLGAEFLKAHRLTNFAIRYQREVRYGQTVSSLVTEPGDDNSTLHQISAAGHAAANAQFWWAES